MAGKAKNMPQNTPEVHFPGGGGEGGVGSGVRDMAAP